MIARRRGVVAAAAAVVAATLIAILGLTAQAEATSYRYWVYWLGGSGSWDFSTRGADRVPADGTVDGWRFAISEEAGSSSTPRVSSSFSAICGDTEPVAGNKRVGLVLDFGTASEAPPGENPPAGVVARCVVVPTTANAYDVLVATTSIRVGDGMVCGISGYPSSGCGESVSDPKPSGDDGGGDPGASEPPGDTTAGASGKPNGSAGPTATQGSLSEPEANGGNERGDHNPDRSAHPGQSDEPTSEPTDAPTPDALSSAAAATLPTTDTGSPLGLIVGVALIASLVVAGLVLARRQR